MQFRPAVLQLGFCVGQLLTACFGLFDACFILLQRRFVFLQPLPVLPPSVGQAVFCLLQLGFALRELLLHEGQRLSHKGHGPRNPLRQTGPALLGLDGQIEGLGVGGKRGFQVLQHGKLSLVGNGLGKSVQHGAEGQHHIGVELPGRLTGGVHGKHEKGLGNAVRVGSAQRLG